MQLKYHKEAEEAGVYIISACGFDSIPNDMGVVFLQKNFGGDYIVYFISNLFIAALLVCGKNNNIKI